VSTSVLRTLLAPRDLRGVSSVRPVTERYTIVLWDVGTYTIDRPGDEEDSDSEDERRRKRRRLAGQGESEEEDP
jgi:hypothetical protein